MGKTVLPIAAAGTVCLLAGVVLTLVFTGEALDSLPDRDTDALRAITQEMRMTRAHLERVEGVLERGLAATRRDIRETLNARTLADAARHRTGRPTALGEPSRVTTSHVSRDDTEPMSSKSVSALEPLAEWKTNADLRSRWLFASEIMSLDAFGTPDEVAARGTSEWWTYWNVEGKSISSEYRLQFNNGRLIEALLVRHAKPRALPAAPR